MLTQFNFSCKISIKSHINAKSKLLNEENYWWMEMNDLYDFSKLILSKNQINWGYCITTMAAVEDIWAFMTINPIFDELDHLLGLQRKLIGKDDNFCSSPSC